jgi:hypothetical protein
MAREHGKEGEHVHTTEDIDARLDQLAKLEAGWDGYLTEPFSETVIKSARVVALAIVAEGHAIAITPTSTETIAIEWMDGNMECIAEVSAEKDD